jgi:mRNA-degrading endonuclease RelE of RelBE toxin-antitoxin system
LIQNAIGAKLFRVARVELTASARDEYNELPMVIHARVTEILLRLQKWPEVSGAKPLRRELKGNFRIRTGDWRVIFRYTREFDIVTIWKIGNRGGVYD